MKSPAASASVLNASAPDIRHLRPRGEGVEQSITTVELFFDLVYVFAITQLSHLILGDLTVAAVGRATFLLAIVWWAWIYTTWMANWFDPESVDSIVHSLDEFFDNYAAYKRSALRGAADARPSWDDVAGNYVRVFRSALGNQ